MKDETFVTLTPPYVYYQCPCLGVGELKVQTTTDNPELEITVDPAPTIQSTPMSPLSRVARRWSAFMSAEPQEPTQQPLQKIVPLIVDDPPPLNPDNLRLQPLPRLYYCEPCKQIRCPACVDDEIFSFYCPNCLFEVPTASVKGEKNRCGRNCFECPICCNTLSVVSVYDPNATSSSGRDSPAFSRGSSAQTANVHYLSCGVCRWDSLEVGLKFDRPTGLAMQIQKAEDDRPDVKEFEHLREYYEKVQRTNSPAGSSSSLFRNSTSLSSTLLLPSLMGSWALNSSKTVTAIKEKIEPYVPLYTNLIPSPAGRDDDTEDKEIVMMENLQLNEVTTLKQRLGQLEDQPRWRSMLKPQRLQLRIRRAKRCRGCQILLIKHELKVQVTRFSKKLIAMNYIPTITIAHPLPSLPLKLNDPVHFVLRFTNPLDNEIRITLSTSPTPNPSFQNCIVKFLAPVFNVSAFNVTDEFDDFGKPVGRLSHEPGVAERKRNATAVIVEIVSLAIGNIEFEMKVSIDHLDTVGIDVRREAFWVAIGVGSVTEEK
ncbi:hypothetical protein HK096_007593 [Nowakowskiella sp. JEL0078]|nr:hypothetical protein HK096_007593 [Nowakowskiella sp. JEL0078]